MERSAIRSVAFGGFDKEDVARYIEQLSQETEKLREERDALQEKADCLEKEADELKTQVQDLSKDNRVRGPATGSRAGGAHGGTDAQGAGPLPAAVPDFDEHI